ncbi:GlsB/YeaQ/YmgE family stress response membrane protein [Leptothermofonsia sichuanensis E412]|uniref:GlsB/YeaQ/YmgE family stress response membrane protein n=1 Tax=Leptothermofonsia sichuanensis TaxID=2917832 RepID=UPI001CA64911|nr:GlsB/YeaQ/YmgE family stress response membrane protein [Leptothermofonsia sichuanensis]QZZ18913.1 GlsB/YeaQ/YmgE family stress response membrane protein [Leptothermofonsia sichuanensis E412]
MNILAWIILGLLAGAIAKAIYPGRQSGSILGTLLLGIVGAFIGGTLYTLLTTGSFVLTSAGLSLGGVVVAVVGSIIGLFLYYSFMSRRVY